MYLTYRRELYMRQKENKGPPDESKEFVRSQSTAQSLRSAGVM